MVFIPAKMPLLIQKIFSKYLWKKHSRDRVLYLTFDDGPIPEVTEKVLQILQDHNAKATFFCIGDNIRKHPEVFKRTIAEGHAIGNHTFNHLKGWKTSTTNYLKNIRLAEEEIQKNNPLFTSQETIQTLNRKYFRPPYGEITPFQAIKLRKLGYTIVMWDVVAIDWKKEIPKEKVLDNVLSNANEGSIVVLHDSLKAANNMLYALPKILEHFKAKGYTFKAL